MRRSPIPLFLSAAPLWPPVFFRSAFSCLRGVIAAALLLTVTAGFAGASTAPTVSSLTPFGSDLTAPVRIAMDQSGYLFVSDLRAGGIVKLTMDGVPASGQSLIPTDQPPLGIAFAANGDLLAAVGDSVDVYTRNNDATYSKRSSFQPSGGFGLANGIAVSPDGTVYVTDSRTHSVAIFSSGYSFRKSIGVKGTGAGEFNLPTAIAFDSAGNQLLVLDTLNGRIQFFNSSGDFVKSIGVLGADPDASDTVVDSALYFTSPQGMALEYSRSTPKSLERIYVVDSYQSRVQVVDPADSGRRLRYIGTYGLNDRSLVSPADLLFDPLNSRVIVANGFGNLVPFGIDGGVNPPVDTPPTLHLTLPNSIIRTPAFTLKGTVDKPAIITITNDRGAVATAATYSTTTEWSAEISGLPLNTQATFIVSARSTGGTTSTAEFKVTYLPTAPTLVVNPFTSVTVADSVTITGTRDEGSTITVGGRTGAQVLTPSATTWSAVLTGLLSGENSFTISASSGSLTTEARITITRALLQTALPSEPITVTSPNLTVSGSILGVYEVKISLNGAPYSNLPVINGGYSTLVPLKNGVNSLLITAEDESGNRTVVSRTISFDPSYPALSIFSLASAREQYGSGSSIPVDELLTLTLSAPAGVVSARVDDTPVPLAKTGDSWIGTIPRLSVGNHTLFATATDSAKASSAMLSFTIVEQSAAPPLSLSASPLQPSDRIFPSDGALNIRQIQLSGTAPGAVAVDLSLNGTPMPVNLNATTGAFDVTMPVEFAAEGLQRIEVTAYGPGGVTTVLTRNLWYTESPSPLTALSAGDVLTVTGPNGYVSAFYLDDNGVRHAVPLSQDGAVSVAVGSAAARTLTFVDSAGNSSRNGRLSNAAGETMMSDLLLGMKMMVGVQFPTTEQLLRGDVGPLVAGEPRPDGRITADDIVAILYRIVGKLSW